MPVLRPKNGRPSARTRRLATVGSPWLASLAAHVLVLHVSGALDLPSRPRSWAIAIQPISAERWEANRGLGAARPPQPRPEEPGRIIALPPDASDDPAREEVPPSKQTRYLAERDQTVDRQTISRYATVSPARVLRVPQERAKGRQGSGERGKAKIAVPGREGLRGGGGGTADAVAPHPPLPEDATPSEVAAPAEVIAPTEQAPAVSAAAPDDGPQDLPPEDSAIPTDGEGGQRIDGRRQSGMPLKEYPRPEGGPELEGEGLEEGAETRLHARRFAPAAFWTEVRARIMTDWEKRADVLVKEYDPLEDTYFYKPRTVVIGLTLEPSGEVRRVKVVESSRLEFYDAIAVAAVREVQPYPQPPRDAIGRDGGASINVRFTWHPSDRKRALR